MVVSGLRKTKFVGFFCCPVRSLVSSEWPGNPEFTWSFDTRWSNRAGWKGKPV